MVAHKDAAWWVQYRARKNPTGRRGRKPDAAIDAEVVAGAPSRKWVYNRRHRENPAVEAGAEGPLDFVVDPFVFGDPDPPQPPQPQLPFQQRTFYIMKLYNRSADCMWLAMLSVNGNIVIVDLYRVPLVRDSDAWCFREVVTAALMAPSRVNISRLQPQSVASKFPEVHARLVDGLPAEIRQQYVLTLRLRLKCTACEETSMSEDQLSYITVSNRNDIYQGSVSDMLAATEGVTKVADCARCRAQTIHSVDRMKIKTPPPKVLVVYISPTHEAHAMVKPPAFYSQRMGRAKYALKHIIASSLDLEAKNVLNGQPAPAPYTHAIALHNVGGQYGWVAIDNGLLRALHFDTKSIPSTPAVALYYVKV